MGVFRDVGQIPTDSNGWKTVGMALGIPSLVAAVTAPGGSDQPGNTGAHEMGHAYGRTHSVDQGHLIYCSNNAVESNTPTFPNPLGWIGPACYSDEKSCIYGFDIQTEALFDNTTRDLMTYCQPWWPSDITYKSILRQIQDEHSGALPAITSGAASPDAADRLCVTGLLDPSGTSLDLDPLFVIPNAPDMAQSSGSGYAVVLRSQSGAELVRHPLTIVRIPESGWSIADAWIPYAADATRVDVEGPGGSTLKTVRAGVRPPVVAITAPSFPTMPGVFTEGVVSLAWDASDPDGDPLTYRVVYSDNDGATWQTLLSQVLTRTVQISVTALSSAARARLGVWATDGIHTTRVWSDPFIVGRRPPTALVQEPEPGLIIALGQTLHLSGVARNGDGESLAREHVRWLSNLDGTVGQGDDVSVSLRSAGQHRITLQVDDGDGGTASDWVEVTVVADPALVPPPPDKLDVYPPTVVLTDTVALEVRNQHESTPIAWTAAVSDTWLHLERDLRGDAADGRPLVGWPGRGNLSLSSDVQPARRAG